jgi:hypothetical protein
MGPRECPDMKKTPTLIFAAAFLASSAFGQSAPQDLDLLKLERIRRIAISRLAGPVTLDGRSDEAAWRDATRFPFIQQGPQFGVAPSERTEAFAGYDDDYLYFAARFYDREPDKIQAPTKKRDAMVANTEWFGVLLDTFNDKENALLFFTAPSGLRLDMTVFNDCVYQSSDMNVMPVNMSWNTFWDNAVARTAAGWFVEVRIPLSSIRFQERDGRVVMGLTLMRWITRKNESDVFPAIPPNWGDMSTWKPSQAQEVEFEGLRARRPLYIAPYVLAGFSRNNDLNDPETAYIRTDTPKFDLGLDVKYGLTNNLTLDMTANTDFAQVEADDAQVNLSRNSLFFPEKRVFFQERSSNFDFNMGGSNTLFYSRRLGLVDDRPVRIYGGARVVGRIGPWDVGFLDMQTAAVEDNPSENFGVLRLRRRVFNPYSYIGGILASRLAADGSYNVAYGLDGIFRLFGDDYLSFHWAQTYETGAANRALSLDPTKLGLVWERRTKNGPAYQFRISRAGRDFDPEMGFMMREDYTVAEAMGLYGWFPGESSRLFSHNVKLDALVYWDNSTGRLQSVDFGPAWTFSFKSGWGGTVGPKLYVEDVAEAFEFSDEADIPVGRYAFGGISGYVSTPQGNLLSGIFTFDAGTFYDGSRFSLGVTPQWSIVPDLELSGTLQWNEVRFPDRGQKYIAPIARLKLLATLTTAFSASAMVQYDGGSDAVIGNVRIRYNPREGTDIYLVYNEGLNTDRFRRMPVPPVSSDRTVLLKFNYTFNF